ncbi:MAG TPA: selenocysteine-specific translation elongation factor [Candidatus Dormibacteraeota bacterium]
MQVIATAGHVDHGKSTLVRALTGMEPDRWAEERRRGMTIDLGYAWTRLPSGRQVAFVDVPGHERFATNMLAGVGPVPAALLVVAADEGWAAQTEDHVQALHALGVGHGLVAVTRSDLADPGAAVEEVADRLAATSLAGIPVVTVSGVTGEGMPRLRAALDDLAARLPAPDPAARVRLWLDRCFTIRGSGTVVTGTLAAGTLRRGDTLELRGRPVTIRALQSLGAPVDRISGTARVAVNLRGVAHDAVHRGDTLLTGRAWLATSTIDVRVDADLPAQLVVHIGSAAVAADVRALSRWGGGSDSVVRLTLARPLPLQVGDRLLLRDPGRRLVLGGAVVLDPLPPPLRRRGAARARAEALRNDPGVPALDAELARRGAATIALLAAIGVEIPDPLPAAIVSAAGWLVGQVTWRRWLGELQARVDAPPTAGLLDTGAVAADLVRALRLPDPWLLDHLIAHSPGLEAVGGRVRRRGASTALRPDVAAAVERLAVALRERPFAAPEQPQLAVLGLGRRELAAAAAAGVILRLPGDVVLLPDAAALAAQRLRALAQPFTLSTARQALETTRRVAVPLLEHLDARGHTERVDDGLRRMRAETSAVAGAGTPAERRGV